MKIKKWQDSCEEFDTNQSRTKSIDYCYLSSFLQNPEIHSHIVDVVRLWVVKAPEVYRYVTLSYVWGGQQKSTLQDRNKDFFQHDKSLSAQTCSKPTWDAIWPYKERYLLVDLLCIVEGTEEKHAQMQAMETIYRGGVMNIVAAAGNHAEYGLPGVGETLPPGISGSNTGERKQNGVNTFEAMVNSSPWNRRAWKY